MRDNWATFVLVPVLSVSFALAATPLLRWWDKSDLGWRKGFRASFAWLCAWTVTMMLISWFAYGHDLLSLMTGAVIQILGVVAFFRMGRGRWYQSQAAGVIKGIVLMCALQITGTSGYVVVIGIGLLGALLT